MFSRCLYRGIDKHAHSVNHLMTSVLSHETEGWLKSRVDQLGCYSCLKRIPIHTGVTNEDIEWLRLQKPQNMLDFGTGRSSGSLWSSRIQVFSVCILQCPQYQLHVKACFLSSCGLAAPQSGLCASLSHPSGERSGVLGSLKSEKSRMPNFFYIKDFG